MWVYIYRSSHGTVKWVFFSLHRSVTFRAWKKTPWIFGTRIEVLKERALQEVKAARDKPVGVCSVFLKQQAHGESHGNNGDGQPGGHVARNQK